MEAQPIGEIAGGAQEVELSRSVERQERVDVGAEPLGQRVVVEEPGDVVAESIAREAGQERHQVVLCAARAQRVDYVKHFNHLNDAGVCHEGNVHTSRIQCMSGLVLLPRSSMVLNEPAFMDNRVSEPMKAARNESSLTDDEYHQHLVADGTDPYSSRMHAARYRFAAETLRVGQRALEIGCASGYGTELLGRSGAEVVAIDLHGAAVASTQRRNPRARAVRADCTRLPFEARAFDLVVCFDVIEHLEKPATLLEQIARVVKPGGRAILSTPNKLASDLNTGQIYAYHVREYYLSEFRAELAARFRRFEVYGQYASFVDDVRAGAGLYRRQSRFWFVPKPIRERVGTTLRSLVYRAMGLGHRGESPTQLGRMEQIGKQRVDIAHDFIAVVEVE
jgi:2-polyprenyl-3-methyl-5-hydroxy-6-metoxy-1,4-benzoquinol methylase